ncbi:hypothetical protein DEU56DRAFT_759365 [Suillus clintonianus]|uniref:uncharacterized protein n=1 Tax=Suillus clintonianus TaxID=1904413 RepID=UPI001B883496|nr:uncharacterized protein DEU56DRAFT_759365 [Suillus clintonianus]KAG2125335.1 hypothetical protein DEU56DRAFT_759365 [Suillus clintonianus]
MTTCISPELFDYSSDRTSISQLSNILGYKFMDAYIGLTANQKLQTELYILSYLLKDRVYPDDLWHLVGERSIEAKQEETLGRHQTICHSGDGGRHAAVERFLMEERKKRCNMEVSLYSQAIGMLEQLRMPHIRAPAKHEIRIPSATSRHAAARLPCVPLPCAPLACSIATRDTCEAWSKRNGTNSIMAAGLFGKSCLFPASHRARSASVILMRISPSLPLLSTWVTAEIQEAFYDAFRMELRMQAELMKKSVATRRSNAYLRNLGLDLLILQAKMRRAKAEIQLYTLAIQNTYESDTSDRSSQTSWGQTIPQPPPPEAQNCYAEDIDDVIDDCDDDGTDDCDDDDTDDDWHG